MGMDKDTEQLLRDIYTDLTFNKMSRQAKDRDMQRIDAVLKRESLWGWFCRLGRGLWEFRI